MKENLKEIWKVLIYPNKEIPPLWEISNYGKIRHKLKQKIIKTHISKKGYFRFNLTDSTKIIYGGSVHRTVLATFLGIPENINSDKLQVNHIDCNKQNNYIENLEWCTNKENAYHAFLNKKLNKKNPRKLTNEQVIEIRDRFEKEQITCIILAKEYEVSKTTIQRVVNNQYFQNLPFCKKRTKKGKLNNFNLTDEKIIQIRELFETTDITPMELSIQYKEKIANIYNILNNKTFKNLPLCKTNVKEKSLKHLKIKRYDSNLYIYQQDTSDEQWKSLFYKNTDYSKFFQISSKGRLYNALTKNFLNPVENIKGFLRCNISCSPLPIKTILIHRAVAFNFLSRIKNKNKVGHLDGDKLNNNISNLFFY